MSDNLDEFDGYRKIAVDRLAELSPSPGDGLPIEVGIGRPVDRTVPTIDDIVAIRERVIDRYIKDIFGTRLFVIDTSGSIGDGFLADFQREAMEIIGRPHDDFFTRTDPDSGKPEWQKRRDQSARSKNALIAKLKAKAKKK